MYRQRQRRKDRDVGTELYRDRGLEQSRRVKDVEADTHGERERGGAREQEREGREREAQKE